jgi:ABC-type polar amino acid transport system ATPase subunit
VLGELRRRFGVMFQAGALWSSMSVGENVMLPLRLFTELDHAEREQRARWKLALVGLEDAFDLEPAELSGGMRKRAAIARALALDPELLYLDEPSSGLDPFSAARLDGLILNLRRHLGTTVVMVTHSIDSVFAVADRVLYLDHLEKTMTALDTPRVLAEHGPDRVRRFLQRTARHEAQGPPDPHRPVHAGRRGAAGGSRRGGVGRRPVHHTRAGGGLLRRLGLRVATGRTGGLPRRAAGQRGGHRRGLPGPARAVCDPGGVEIDRDRIASVQGARCARHAWPTWWRRG